MYESGITHRLPALRSATEARTLTNLKSQHQPAQNTEKGLAILSPIR